MKEELRRRAFNLVAPIVFANSIVEVATDIRTASMQESMIAAIFERSIQERVIFEDHPEDSSINDRFSALCLKQLEYCIAKEMADCEISEFLVNVHRQFRNQPVDEIKLKFLEIKVFEKMTFDKYSENTQYTYRNLLAIIALFGEDFSEERLIEKLLSEFENNNIKF